jgi:sugar (pentulose or hexulose) kinase
MDRATAGYTGLADVARLAWDEHLLARAGLPPGSLPGIASATELAGRAAGEFARATQLREGTPVALSSSDGTTAMYGTGVLLPGVATLVSGTTDVLMVASRERPDDPGMRLTVNPAMVDGLFLVGGATGLSCGALDYFCSLFGTEIRDREEEIASLPFDENAPFALPGLTGERSPYWNADARGGLVGLGLGHGSAHILRAVMESTCFRLAALLELLGDSGMAPQNIAISGGGSRSGAWNRMRADATGMPVELALRDEATMAGTALFLESALTGAGLIELSAARIGFGEAWEPAARLVEQYRARRTRFESLLAAGQVSTRR